MCDSREVLALLLGRECDLLASVHGRTWRTPAPRFFSTRRAGRHGADMRRQVYRGRIVDLGIERVTLPNGVEVELEIIRHPGAAAVVAVDAEGRVTLIRQFRHAAGGYIWELPAGVLDHPGESPEACAGRELLEETGLRAARLTPLTTIFTTPGFTDERIHLFLAQDLERGGARARARRGHHGDRPPAVPRGARHDSSGRDRGFEEHLWAASGGRGARGGPVKVGLTGFPGAGKTTVFAALTGLRPRPGDRRAQIGTIKVPDPRVDFLAEVYSPKKTTLRRGDLRRLPASRASAEAHRPGSGDGDRAARRRRAGRGGARLSGSGRRGRDPAGGHRRLRRRADAGRPGAGREARRAGQEGEGQGARAGVAGAAAGAPGGGHAAAH